MAKVKVYRLWKQHLYRLLCFFGTSPLFSGQTLRYTKYFKHETLIQTLMQSILVYHIVTMCNPKSCSQHSLLSCLSTFSLLLLLRPWKGIVAKCTVVFFKWAHVIIILL